MSEPIFTDVLKIRTESKEDRILNEALQTKDFLSTSIDESGNIKNESIFGSLPNSVMLEELAKRLRKPEYRLANSIHHKSIHASDFLMHSQSMAFNNKPLKDLGKTIVSAAETSKKIVRFADSFGLDLANVRVISTSSLADVFSNSAVETEKEFDDELSQTTCSSPTNVHSKPFLVLIPLFGIKKVVL